MNITIIHDNHGDTIAHRAGCAHLNRGKYRGLHAYDITADTVDDITFEVWGASLVATDDYPGDHLADPDAYRAHTIDHYTGCVSLAPCVKLPAPVR